MNVSLEWSNEQDVYEITDPFISKLKQLLEITAEMEGLESGEVDLTFVDDETIHRLNKEYRGIDRPTDVLSFAMRENLDDDLDIVFEEESPSEMLGDIIISVPTALAQSEEYGHSAERELGFLFVHGLLHLLGYDHDGEDQEKVMFSKQESVLLQAGLTR
ncbi:rRNA maturation RNase YbeY [Marinicrinis lubricantis]|uniref:Endoribonuclease YbeY n=1 Tax=Marinicrinis lubricantis TaxID=2086470 RepID=A0ABW1IUN5_9BACL